MIINTDVKKPEFSSLKSNLKLFLKKGILPENAH